MNPIDSNEPDVCFLEPRLNQQISDYHYIPDTIKLSESVKSCLQEYEDAPKDFNTMFDTKLFTYDYSLVPAALELYEKLGVKQEPISLIQPQVRS